jgi:hypothetical protein
MASERIQKILDLWEQDDTANKEGRLPRWRHLIDDPRVISGGGNTTVAFMTQHEDDIEHLTLDEARETLRMRSNIVLKKLRQNWPDKKIHDLWKYRETEEEHFWEIERMITDVPLNHRPFSIDFLYEKKGETVFKQIKKSAGFISIHHGSWYCADTDADEIARKNLKIPYFNKWLYIWKGTESWRQASSEAEALARDRAARIRWGHWRSWFAAEAEADTIALAKVGLEDIKKRIAGDHVSDMAWELVELEEQERRRLAICLPPSWTRFLEIDDYNDSQAYYWWPKPPKHYANDDDRKLAARWLQREEALDYGFDCLDQGWQDYCRIIKNPELKKMRRRLNGRLCDAEELKKAIIAHHEMKWTKGIRDLASKHFETPAFRVICLYGLEQIVLILLEPTGILYQNQVGGCACYQEYAEGILAPLDHGAGLLDFLSVHMRDMTRGCTMTDNEADLVDAQLKHCLSTKNLRVDRSKLNESFEAWLHVIIDPYADDPYITGFSNTRGILTWPNSD